jgi:hypothetical protein
MEKQGRIDMVTAHGHHVIYDDPSSTLVDFRDFKTHTRNICRYNGALNWKLVQHLVLCATLIDYTQPLNASMRIQRGYAVAHDLHEIYVCDIPTGFKAYLNSYTWIEAQWEKYVHQQIGLDLKFRNNGLIKYIDHRALVCEMTMLHHPAAKLVQEEYDGKPSKDELYAWNAVKSLSLDICWAFCFNSIVLAKSQLEEDKEKENYGNKESHRGC